MEETVKTPLIQDTFDTARMTAFCRAIESEQAKPHFNDPYARLLAGERGAEIVGAMPGGNEKTWPVVLRTCVYDEIIMRLVEEEKVDTVINLAAGLDARPYRLALPSSLRWIEIDLPHVLAYKTEKLAEAQPTCQLERIPLDILNKDERQALFARVSEEARQALVIAEGLLIYLTVEQVSDLAADLHAHDALRWWLAEFVTPRMLQQDERRWNTLSNESVHTHFSPPGGVDFFRLHGWNTAEFRPMITEGLRLRLPVPNAWLLRLLAWLAPAKPGEDPHDVGACILLENDAASATTTDEPQQEEDVAESQ
jgi:methyltransferase (TIGR00027 family)